MLHNETHWQTKDGVNIYGQVWRPDDKPKATIALIHGLGEHTGRYQHVAKFFTQAGYALSTMDLRGHGQSGGPRGHFPSFQIVMADIQQLLDETQKTFQNTPLFLYGHSLGGALVLYFGLTQKSSIKGIIATAPALTTGSPVPAVKLIAGKMLNLIAPQFAMNNGLGFDSLSHDPEVKKVYLNDPLVHSMISARLGIQLLNAGKWIRSHKGQFPYPLLLMQGGDDRIVNAAANREFAQGLTGDVTFKWWPGLCHELHNEYNKDEVMAVMIDWLNKR